MGKEASSAPKERINVTFKPATGGAVEEIELPMKVTILGDFRQAHDGRPLMDRKPVGINKNNFADVMAKQNLVIDIAVPRKLQDEDSEVDLPVKLKIESMRDFEPGTIIHQVPELDQLNQLREALVSLKGPLGNLPSFQKALEDILKDPRKRQEMLREISESGIDLPAGQGETKPDPS
jgi:type VI secretion system protein ImpB